MRRKYITKEIILNKIEALKKEREVIERRAGWVASKQILRLWSD